MAVWPSTKVSWRRHLLADATVTLNGGTVLDLAGGGTRMTIPSGTTVHPKDGVLLMWPAIGLDGVHVVGRTRYRALMQLLEILPAGLSSDTKITIGLADGPTLTTATVRWSGVSLHYTAANRTVSFEVGTGVTAVFGDDGTPGGLSRGVEQMVARSRSGTSDQRWFGATGIDAAKVGTTDEAIASSRRLDPNPLYWFVSGHRSGPTAGVETIEFFANSILHPAPR